MFGIRRGAVTSFDPGSGLGVVAEASGVEWPFHCVSIADGSRTIDPGTPVEFFVEQRVTRLEAVSLRPSSLSR